MAKNRITKLVSDDYVRGVLTGHSSPDENAFYRQTASRYDRLRGCLGKVQYVTAEAASKAARGLSVYKCRSCDFFHYGHKKGA